MEPLAEINVLLTSGQNEHPVEPQTEPPTQPPRSEFLCSKCSYKTKLDHLYQRHVVKHSLDKPFQCLDCGLTDYNHSSFTDHLADHQQTKILRCCFCEYRSNVFGLRLHMAKHRPVEPYDCSLCKFSSYLPGSLKTHVETLHTKKFSCNYCKKIMTKYVLIKHTKKVHGVDIQKGKGKSLVMVNPKRGTSERNLFDEPDAEPPVDGFSEYLAQMKSFPKVILKRLNIDCMESVDSNNGRHHGGISGDNPEIVEIVTASSQVDSPEILPNLSASTDASSVEMVQLVHIAGDRAHQLAESEKFDYRTHGNSLDFTGLDFGSVPPELYNGADSRAEESDLPETANPETVLPDFSSTNEPQTSMGISEPVAFPDQVSGTALPDFMDPDADAELTPMEPMGFYYCDTFEVLPPPKSPDEPVEVPVDEEIDVKPDLDSLLRIISSATRNPKTMYHCNDCDFSTAKKSFLRQHAPKHLLNQNFICTDCEFEEPSPYIFAKHLASRRTPNSVVIRCCFCDCTYKDISSMSKHLEKHKPTKLDDCPKCGMVFASALSLREHYHSLHRRKWECNECGKWMSKYSLKKHKLNHHRKKYKPQKIDGQLSKSEVPNEVREEFTGIPTKPAFNCSSCNYSTRMKSLLKRHVLKHLLPGADLVCSRCGFTNTSSIGFAAHLQQHKNGDSYDCSFCEYSTTTLHNLASHLEIHRSVHFVDCDKCKKSYARKSALYAHKRAFHIDKHECSDCGKIMTQHKLLIHRIAHGYNKIPPHTYNQSKSSSVPQALYKCNFCKYSTDIESLYTNHTAKHSMEEAYFKCPTCEYRDQNAKDFIVHVQAHSGSPNNTLACCFCGFTCTRYRILCNHLEVHRSVHFYDCAKCDKSYGKSKSLWTHNHTYHIDEHTCTDCGEVMTYHELLGHKKAHGTPSAMPGPSSAMPGPSSAMPGPSSAMPGPSSAMPGPDVFLDPSFFNCYHCSYATKYKSLLRLHAVKHLLDSRLVCPACDFKDDHAREFAKHCISCQGGFFCSFCSFSTVDLHNLSQHLETHRSVLLYDCAQCTYSCATLTYLKIHCKNIHVPQHKCPDCDIVLSRFELKKHRLQHSPAAMSVRVGEPGRLFCGHCDYSTDMQHLLDRHVAKHDETDVMCTFCDFGTKNSIYLARHLVQSHQWEDGSYSCCFCSFSTIHKKNLADHIEGHQSFHFYDCPKCEVSCSNKKNLKKHYDKYHVEEHVCPSCNEVVTYHKLRIHEEMHAEQEDPTFFCNGCEYKTKKKHLIRSHVTKHLNSEFVCPKCRRREPNADAFTKHLNDCLLNSVREMSGLPMSCWFCSYSTTDEACLKQHLVNHTFDPVSFFDCPKCEKSFSCSTGLAEHVRHYHKEKQRCSVCGKIMTYYKLITHMKLHLKSGVKGTILSNRFRCNHCTFTTKKKSLLRLHAPKHLVDNRLFCTMCSYVTNFPKKFAAHLQSHSKDDNVGCCFCGYSTTSFHSLASHVDTHRAVFFHDCWKCDKSYFGSHTLKQHFQKMHKRKHVCYKDKCYKQMSLYRLQKHQAEVHKAFEKEIPYYVCRGPLKKKEQEEKVALTPENDVPPQASNSFIEIIVIEDSE